MKILAKDFLNMKSHSPSDKKILIGGVKGFKYVWHLGVLYVNTKNKKEDTKGSSDSLFTN